MAELLKIQVHEVEARMPAFLVNLHEIPTGFLRCCKDFDLHLKFRLFVSDIFLIHFMCKKLWESLNGKFCGMRSSMVLVNCICEHLTYDGKCFLVFVFLKKRRFFVWYLSKLLNVLQYFYLWNADHTRFLGRCQSSLDVTLPCWSHSGNTISSSYLAHGSWVVTSNVPAHALCFSLSFS